MYVGLTPSVENSNSTKRSVPLEQEFSGGLPLNLSAALAPPGSRTDGFWARTGTVALLGLQASRRLQIPNVIPHKRSLSPPPRPTPSLSTYGCFCFSGEHAYGRPRALPEVTTEKDVEECPTHRRDATLLARLPIPLSKH